MIINNNHATNDHNSNKVIAPDARGAAGAGPQNLTARLAGQGPEGGGL